MGAELEASHALSNKTFDSINEALHQQGWEINLRYLSDSNVRHSTITRWNTDRYSSKVARYITVI